jgi:hypothetical protein
MMQGVSCDKELITERYDYLRKQMSPDAHLSIFPIGSWREPWGFGRENTVEANKVYSEAMISLGFNDEDVKLSDDEYSDQVLFVLRSKDQFGIVYVAECPLDMLEWTEDLFNHIMAQVPKERVPVELKQAPEIKKPDNLVINKMTLFSGNLPL